MAAVSQLEKGWSTSQRVLNDLQRTRISCRRMIWLLAHPLRPPLPSGMLDRRHTIRLRKRDNVPKGGGGGDGAKSNDGRKVQSSTNHSILSGNCTRISKGEFAFFAVVDNILIRPLPCELTNAPFLSLSLYSLCVICRQLANKMFQLVGCEQYQVRRQQKIKVFLFFLFPSQSTYKTSWSQLLAGSANLRIIVVGYFFTECYPSFNKVYKKSNMKHIYL